MEELKKSVFQDVVNSLPFQQSGLVVTCQLRDFYFEIFNELIFFVGSLIRNNIRHC